jgi:RES domain-containing protein
LRITAWRIFKKRYKKFALRGEGARVYGGRWNSKGTAVIYTSQSPSLAVLEILVHLQAQDVLDDYLLAPVSFDLTLVESVRLSNLPSSWRRYPAPAALQKTGDRWIERGSSAVFKVPSVIIPDESNYLLNPAHPDFARCILGKAKPFKFDPRLR